MELIGYEALGRFDFPATGCEDHPVFCRLVRPSCRYQGKADDCDCEDVHFMAFTATSKGFPYWVRPKGGYRTRGLINTDVMSGDVRGTEDLRSDGCFWDKTGG